MKHYIVYDGNGTILRTGCCPDDMVAIQVSEGELVMEGEANDALQFILNGKVIDKPKISASIDKTTIQSGGSDVATLSGLPVPATMTIENSTTTVTDGVAQISVNAPGDYPITVTAVNYLDWTMTLHAN